MRNPTRALHVFYCSPPAFAIMPFILTIRAFCLSGLHSFSKVARDAFDAARQSTFLLQVEKDFSRRCGKVEKRPRAVGAFVASWHYRSRRFFKLISIMRRKQFGAKSPFSNARRSSLKGQALLKSNKRSRTCLLERKVAPGEWLFCTYSTEET